jgi:chorismate mutase
MGGEDKLQDLKDEIRDIDVKIVLLLNQRADFSTELNNLKNKMGLPLYDKMEEMEIMEDLEDIAAYTNMISSVYPGIFKYSRSLYED